MGIRLFLLALLLFKYFEPTDQAGNNPCWKASKLDWRMETGSNTTKIISAALGSEAVLDCNAYEKFLPSDDCAHVKVVWYGVKTSVAEKYIDVNNKNFITVALAGWTSMEQGDQMNLLGLKSQNGLSYIDQGRYYAVHNILVILNVSRMDSRLYYCEIFRQPGQAQEQRHYSFVNLTVESCLNTTRKQYRGGPCHYGRCFRNRMKFNSTVKGWKFERANMSFDYLLPKNSERVVCKCLPGFEGDYCDKDKQLFWGWRIVTWLPGILLFIGVGITLILLSNKKKTIIFKEAEGLSRFLKPPMVQPKMMVKGIPPGKMLPPGEKMPKKMSDGSASEKSMKSERGDSKKSKVSPLKFTLPKK